MGEDVGEDMEAMMDQAGDDGGITDGTDSL